MKAIINTKLVMLDGIIWDGAMTYENGRIVDAGWAKDVNIPEGTECIDAGGLYTAPGLIDVHIHGGGDYLFAENPQYCSDYFIKHGETTVLPTLYHNLTFTDMIEGAARIREASKTGTGKIMNGLYMEGPYMSLSGSFQSGIKWKNVIDKSEYEALVDQLGDQVRVWAIDPARENIDAFMAYAKEKNPDVIFAYGHSRASAQECRRVHKYGVKVRTHLGDGGKAKGFAQGTIGAGCDEYTLYDPDLYAEIICDQNGVHLDPDMVKMIVRTKGVERTILITDSMFARENYTNNEAEGIAYGPDLNYDDVGHLAGSRMTLENAVRNLMTHTGYGLCHAIRFATANPAKMLGLEHEIGTLESGMKANFILIDDMVHVNKVFLEGDLAVENGEVVL